jgi:hypothetical protein
MSQSTPAIRSITARGLPWDEAAVAKYIGHQSLFRFDRIEMEL